jgi:hypothetical protein
MDMYSFEDINSVWMKPIKKSHISPEEEGEINLISMILISEFQDTINNVTNRIIHKELSKRPKASLRQKLLIKQQVINNVSENITNITINMAKKKYDIIRTEPELKIVEQVEMNCDNFDLDIHYNYYDFLNHEDNSMQIDYSNDSSNLSNSNYLYHPLDSNDTNDDSMDMLDIE